MTRSISWLGSLVLAVALTVIAAGAWPSRAANPTADELLLAPLHHLRGLGAEALRALLGYLFSDLGKHRVSGSVDACNAASLALLRRVGIRQEAHFVQSCWSKGEWTDDVVFGILKREWAETWGA